MRKIILRKSQIVKALVKQFGKKEVTNALLHGNGRQCVSTNVTTDNSYGNGFGVIVMNCKTNTGLHVVMTTCEILKIYKVDYSTPQDIAIANSLSYADWQNLLALGREYLTESNKCGGGSIARYLLLIETMNVKVKEFGFTGIMEMVDSCKKVDIPYRMDGYILARYC